MPRARLAEADDDRAQVGGFEPHRHGTAKHAGLGWAAALSSDDEHELHATRLGAGQEIAQDAMRFVLAVSVEVERVLRREAASRQTLPQSRLQRRERRRRECLRDLFDGLRYLRNFPRGDNRFFRDLGQHPCPGPPHHALRDASPQPYLRGRKPARPGARLHLLFHNASANGNSTIISPVWRKSPAIRPASSPEPTKISARFAPTIAVPVSCAIISRRNGVGVG